MAGYGYEKFSTGDIITIICGVAALGAVLVGIGTNAGLTPADPVQVTRTTITNAQWTVDGDLKVVGSEVVGKVDYGSRHCQLDVTAPTNNPADVIVRFSNDTQKRIRTLSYQRALQGAAAYGRDDCV